MVADPVAGATYVYDGSGTRIQKCLPNCTSPSSSTVFLFSGSQDIAEYDNGAAPASPSREYIYAAGKLVAKIESSATNYYHQDHLSNRLVTDSSGNTVAQRGHYPFGEKWYDAGTTSKLMFTTYERDSESGNDYAMARYYISRLGRFNSADPVGGNPANPQSWNRYSYVLNDPINLTDPEGEYCQWDDGTSDDPPEGGGASQDECAAQGGTWIDDAPDFGNGLGGDPGSLLNSLLESDQPPAPPGYEDCIDSALKAMIANDEGTASAVNNGYGKLVQGTIIGTPDGFESLVDQRFVGQAYFSMDDPENLSPNDAFMVRVRGGSCQPPGICSTAFGRYQILVGTANQYGMTNYSPQSQEDAMTDIMNDKGMIEDAMKGQIVQAIWDGNTQWASLPDSPYGQGGSSWGATIGAFQNALNTLPECQ